MAIEIRELIIRATVAPEGEKKAASAPPQGPSNEQIVAECVEAVLDVLRLKEER